MVEQELQTQLVVGLGNPGSRYVGTRHNIGFLVLQRLAQMKGLTLKEESRWPGFSAKGRTSTGMIHLLLPTTYMNESGRALQRYLSYFKLRPTQVIVVVDDVAQPFGQLRVRAKGSAGGHNGLKSIQAHLGTNIYRRIKMGIGAQRPGQDLADYVLAKFTAKELSDLEVFLDRGAQVAGRLLEEDVEDVMNAVNVRTAKKQLNTQCTDKVQENDHESRREQAEPL